MDDHSQPTAGKTTAFSFEIVVSAERVILGIAQIISLYTYVKGW
jgi:hypothetical protein